MICFVQVKLFEVLVEHNDRIADEEMGKVGGEKIVHTASKKALFEVFVDNEIGV